MIKNILPVTLWWKSSIYFLLPQFLRLNIFYFHQFIWKCNEISQSPTWRINRFSILLTITCVFRLNFFHRHVLFVCFMCFSDKVSWTCFPFRDFGISAHHLRQGWRKFIVMYALIALIQSLQEHSSHLQTWNILFDWRMSVFDYKVTYWVYLISELYVAIVKDCDVLVSPMVSFSSHTSSFQFPFRFPFCFAYKLIIRLLKVRQTWVMIR